MTIYLDVDGNELTKEEYEEMQKAGLSRKRDLKPSKEGEAVKDKKK